MLLEETPGASASEATHRRFEMEYRRGCGAFFATNRRGNAAADTEIAAQVLAAAVAGAVHDAARLGLLASPPFRRELIALVESSPARRRVVAG